MRKQTGVLGLFNSAIRNPGMSSGAWLPLPNDILKNGAKGFSIPQSAFRNPQLNNGSTRRELL